MRLPLLIVRTGRVERAACRTALPRERFRSLALIRHQRVADERPLLGKADVMFNPGRLGLNGAPGCGRSTGATPVTVCRGAELYNRPWRRHSAGDSENEVGGRA